MRKLVTVSLCLLACGTLASAADVTGNLRFVGITPCRLADTRGGAYTGQAGAPILAADANRTFQVTGTVPGIPTQCGIPTHAKAISVNLTVTGFTGAGDIRVFPGGGSLPAASILNYSLENIANATSVPLGPGGITVRADASATHLIIDVNGYYVASPVDYNGLFILNAGSALSQCADWNSFRTSLAGETFSRVTLYGSAGAPISCGSPAVVAQIVNAMATKTSLSVACDGRTWNVGGCGTDPAGGINTALEVNSRAAGAGVCACDNAATIRPCIDSPTNSNWGGMGGVTCNAASQQIGIRFER